MTEENKNSKLTQSRASWTRSKSMVWKSIFFNWVFAGCCIASICAGIYMISTNQSEKGYALFGAALVAFFLQNPDGLESFKMWGVEATLRKQSETLERLSEQAIELVKINTGIAFNTLADLNNNDKFGSTRLEKSAQVQKLESNLIDSGVSKEEIEVLKKTWHKSVYIDLVLPMLASIGQAKTRVISSIGAPKPVAGIQPNAEAQVKIDEVAKLNALKTLNFWSEDIEVSYAPLLAILEAIKSQLKTEELEEINAFKKHVDFYVEKKSLRDVKYWEEVLQSDNWRNS